MLSPPLHSPPRWPYTINQLSPQAQDLVALYPMLDHGGGNRIIDIGPRGYEFYCHNGSAFVPGKWTSDERAPGCLFFDQTYFAYHFANVVAEMTRPECTITVWCKRLDYADGGVYCGPPVGYWSGEEPHYPYAGANYISTLTSYRVPTSDVIGFYDWHLYAAATRPGMWEFSQNAILSTSHADGLSSLAGMLGTSIGGSGSSFAHYSAFYGLIGEVRFYNRFLGLDELRTITDESLRYEVYHELGRRSVWYIPPTLALILPRLAGAAALRPIAVRGTSATLHFGRIAGSARYPARNSKARTTTSILPLGGIGRAANGSSKGAT